MYFIFKDYGPPVFLLSFTKFYFYVLAFYMLWELSLYNFVTNLNFFHITKHFWKPDFFFLFLETGRGEAEAERIWSRLHAQCGAQCGILSHDPEIMTWAEVRSHQTLNWMGHPRPPDKHDLKQPHNSAYVSVPHPCVEYRGLLNSANMHNTVWLSLDINLFLQIADGQRARTLLKFLIHNVKFVVWE